MRKKTLILVAFLMMSLCLIPSATAGYGDESPQSITSFSETLPDDVMFFPDGIANDTVLVADTGDDDYADSQVLDSTYWSTTIATLEEAEFHLLMGIEEFDYAFYGHATVIECWFKIQNDADSWIILETIATGGDAWYNGTVTDPDYFKTDNEIHFAILDDVTGDGSTIECDYLEITSVSFMTLADDDHYAESFSDVSDWTYNLSSGAGAYDFTSDGDIATMEKVLVTTATEYVGYTISGTWSGTDYFEMRWMCNGKSRIHAQIWDGSEWDVLINYERSITDYVTTKIYLGAYGTSFTWLRLLVDDYSNAYNSDSLGFMLDYLRISPANESGWQHDGSTTHGVSESGSGTVSSDGDTVTFVSGAIGDNVIFTTDATSTRSSISVTHYPFYEFSISSVVDTDADGNVWKLRVYGDDTNSYPIGYSDDTGIFRGNLLALDLGDIFRFTFYLADANEEIEIDYIKFYSIANFTFTQSVSCVNSDIFYVDSGALKGSKTTDYYQTFWYDPVLSVDTEMYNVVEANITKDGYPNVVGFNWAGTVTGIGETWYLVDEKSAALDPSVLTDMRISIDVLGDWTLYGIAYVDDHTWRGFTTVTVWFEVIAFEGTLGMLLIFGGLILIPASTLYAVKGGREEMNTDKLFYVLIAFVIGWALVIGGIYA